MKERKKGGKNRITAKEICAWYISGHSISTENKPRKLFSIFELNFVLKNN